MASTIVFMLTMSTALSRLSAFSPGGSSLRNAMSRTSSGSRLSMSSVRVATYNVLSSHLGGADYFTSCKPEHLDAGARLETLKKKLDVEIASKAIICLQEISTPWACLLHIYFVSKGYHMVTGLYGNKFNGYAVAVFRELPELFERNKNISVDISRKKR